MSAEVVQALLRAGRVAEATDRAEAVLARRHAAEVDVPLRLALLGGLALQNRAAEVISLAQASLAGETPLRPSELVPVLAQESWAFTYSGDAGAGEAAARRALGVAEDAGDAALTVWALTALLVATGEIVVALDADTQFERAAISRLVRWFVDERIGAVAGNAKVGNRVNLVSRWQAVEYVTAQNIEDPEGKLVMSISANRAIKLGGTDVKWSELAAKLKSNERVQRESQLYIEADKDLPYAVVITAMAIAKDANVTKVMMLTEPTDTLQLSDLDTPSIQIKKP